VKSRSFWHGGQIDLNSKKWQIFMRTATFQNGARATDGDDGTLAKTEASVKNTLRPSGNIFVFVLLCGKISQF